MNITEANDLNTVLEYVLNLTSGAGAVPSSERAREAAARLADKAHKPLMAGLTSERVNAAWPDLELPGDGVMHRMSDDLTSVCGAESHDLAVSWAAVTCPACLGRKP